MADTQSTAFVSSLVESNHFQMTKWKIWFLVSVKEFMSMWHLCKTGKWNMTEGCAMQWFVCHLSSTQTLRMCIVGNFKWICSQINFTFPVHNMFYTLTRICNRRRWIVCPPPAVWISIEIICWLVSVSVCLFSYANKIAFIISTCRNLYVRS